MGLVIAMRGIPGSGKSFEAKRIAEEAEKSGFTVRIVSADDGMMENGEYRFSPSKLPSAHAACFRNLIRDLTDGIEFIIVDNTNLHAWEISPAASAAAAYGYRFEVVSVNCDQDVAFRRQTHGVPEQAHKRMALDYAKNDVLPWWKHVTA
jgi:tRNA uridine 5-carbamoylmethylation protein Kti12